MIIPEASLLGLFVVAAIVLLLTPGPAVLYIVTRSVAQGRLAGLVSALGVHVGTLSSWRRPRSGSRPCWSRQRSRSTS